MRRKAFIAAAVFVLLLLAVLVAIPLLVDADRFRPQVEAQLRESLGREVKIGKLKLAMFTGAVTASELSIADDPAFSKTPFVRAKSLDIGVRLLPLIFGGALQVDSLEIDGPELTLLRTPAGKWNFSSLGATHAPAKSPAAAANFSVGKLTLKNGRMHVGRPGAPARMRTYTDVNVTAKNISYTSPIPFTLEAKTPGGGALQVEGTAGPINRTDAAQTPLDAKVKLDHVDIGATGFIDASSGIAGILDYTGTIKSDGKTARSEGSAKIQNVKLVRSGRPATSPVQFDYASDYDVARQTGALTKGAIRTGSSTARLGGTYDLRGESPAVRMRLSGQNLPVRDIQGLLPALGVVLPAGASLQSGTANATLDLVGPVDRLVTTGPINLSNAKLSGFNLGSKLSGLGALAGVRTGPDTVIQLLDSRVRVAPDGIRTDNLSMIVAGVGKVTGNGTIGANNALNYKMVAELANTNLLGGMSQLANLGQKKGAIPFMITGTTSNPIFVPDVGAAMTNTVTAPAQGVGGILGGFFGKKK